MHERRVPSEPGAHAAMERALRARVRCIQRAQVRDVRAACVISWRAGGLANPLARVTVYPLTHRQYLQLQQAPLELSLFLNDLAGNDITCIQVILSCFLFL